MTTAPPTDGLTERVRNVIGNVPVDLLVVGIVASIIFALFPGYSTDYSLPRAILGLVFVLVLPGYALLSAVFPGRPTGSVVSRTQATAYSPATAERIALSFVFSLALLPLLAVGHGFFGIPFDTVSIIGSVTVVVILFSIVGTLRRLALPPSQRYSPPSVSERVSSFQQWVVAGGTTDTLLSIALTIAIVFAVGTLAIGLTEPTQGGAYTSVSLVSEGADGEFVASDYPTNFTAGEAQNLTVQVENNYETRANYTTAVELQRVSGLGGESLDVVDRERVETLSAQVPPNETWTHTHTIEPTMTGSDLRLVYYVYRGDVPETPSEDSAEVTTQLWVSVQ